METTQPLAGASETARTPRRRVRCRLDNMADVKRELARLYRAGRGGELPVQDASRLASVLAVLSRTIEGSDLEQRIQALERMDHGE